MRDAPRSERSRQRVTRQISISKAKSSTGKGFGSGKKKSSNKNKTDPLNVKPNKIVFENPGEFYELLMGNYDVIAKIIILL